MSERSAVLFNTPWTNPADGWSIASRAYTRALYLGGVDVFLRDWQRPGDAPLDPEVIEEMVRVLADPDRPVRVMSELVAREYPPERIPLHVFSCALLSAEKMGVLDSMALNAAEQRQAFYCVFERRHIEPSLIEKLSGLDGVWVQCRMNERVLREAGVEDVTLIPYPFFDSDPHLLLDKPSREPRHFYYIGRFEPRKAPDNVIRAFLRAFAPGESRLTIKTSPIPHVSEYPSAWSTIDAELLEPDVARRGWTSANVWDDVRLVEGRLSAEDMVRLHAEGDVYVTASRGEGLDLPCWAAKLAGRRIITTASGGPEDFLDPEVDLLVPATGLVPADPSYPWGEGADYIDYRLEDLVEAMQRARGEHACGTRTWPGWEAHRAPRVAQALRDWVESLTCGTRSEGSERIRPQPSTTP